MSTPTFYDPECGRGRAGRTLRLKPDEADHVRSLRLRTGDEVRVTDGAGELSLQPVEFRRSRSVADAGRSDAFWRKAGRRAVGALKQCGAARLPEIGPVRDLHAYLGRSRRPTPDGPPEEGGPDVLLDRTGARRLGEALDRWDGGSTARVLLGPEGGLEDEERRACREAGFRPATLGGRILRFETAAVAALAVAADRMGTPDEESSDA